MIATVVAVQIVIGATLAQSPNNPGQSLQLQPASQWLTHDLDLTRSFAGMDLMKSTQALFGTQKPTKEYNFFDPRPNAIPWGPVNGLLPDPCGSLFSPIRNLEVASQEQLGIRWDIYNVTVYQMTSSSLTDDPRDEGANRFNLRADLKLWDLGGGAMGRFTAQMRQSNAFPQSIEVGSAIGTDIVLDSNYTGLLGTRLVRVRYEQGILDNHVMGFVGKINANDYLLNNPFAGDETTQFMASIFDGSDATQSGFNGYMLGTGAMVVPFEGFYGNFVVTNPSTAGYRGLGTDGLGSGLWWFGTEVGAITNFFGDEKAPGKYSVGFNTTNAAYTSTDLATAATGNGYWVMATEYLTQDIGVWTQFTYCDPNVALYKTEFTVGMSMDNCFGRKRDGFGVAWGYTTAPQETLGVQTVTELYYRVQLTDSIQITPDIQVITNPTDPLAGTSQGYSVFVFGIRALVHF
ncbi:MAG: hypothetical protein EXS03_07885 [Phycisphaerales bacterium]|nr:hypothetical protein [Phycisphaerales bacterium]